MDDAIDLKNVDRRVKRTKKMLRESLFALLNRKPADKITVKELTEGADVNRSTFYFYYKDIDDMIISIQDEMFTVFRDEVLLPEVSFNGVDGLIEYASRFFFFCKNNEKICRFVVSNDPKNILSRKIKQTILNNIVNSKKNFPETDPRRYLTIFAVSAVWAVVVDWLYDGMKVPPEEMAAFVGCTYFHGSKSIKGSVMNKQ